MIPAVRPTIAAPARALLALAFLLALLGLRAQPAAAAPAAQFSIALACSTTGQLCDPPYSVTVQAQTQLGIDFAISGLHCGPIRQHVLLDGKEVLTTGWLGWAGAPAPFAALPLETGILDLGPVSAGAHTLGLRAEGEVGGCNHGGFDSWGGTLKVYTGPGAGCVFRLGFQTLHDRLSGKIGFCEEDEQHNPANGDALQHTAGGLLVWRKADNWTAFTDGYRTWVNGPYGIQERLNSQRFRWEANPDGLPVVG